MAAHKLHHIRCIEVTMRTTVTIDDALYIWKSEPMDKADLFREAIKTFVRAGRQAAGSPGGAIPQMPEPPAPPRGNPVTGVGRYLGAGPFPAQSSTGALLPRTLCFGCAGEIACEPHSAPATFAYQAASQHPKPASVPVFIERE